MLESFFVKQYNGYVSFAQLKLFFFLSHTSFHHEHTMCFCQRWMKILESPLSRIPFRPWKTFLQFSNLPKHLFMGPETFLQLSTLPSIFYRTGSIFPTFYQLQYSTCFPGQDSSVLQNALLTLLTFSGPSWLFSDRVDFSNFSLQSTNLQNK